MYLRLVEWKDQASGKVYSCATKNNRPIDPRAISDETLCGSFVTLRMGNARGMPTCIDCRRIIKEQNGEIMSNKSDQVIKMAISWWRGLCPNGWAEWQHLENPFMNCKSAIEEELSRAVVAHLKEVGVTKARLERKWPKKVSKKPKVVLGLKKIRAAVKKKVENFEKKEEVTSNEGGSAS